MKNPSVNSIVERLSFDAQQLRKMSAACKFAGTETSVRVTDPSGLLADLDEAATIISELQALLYLEKNKSANLEQNHHELETRLQAENERLQCALMFWMPGVDLRLDEATREQCANDAGLLAGYSGPLVGRRWGNEIIDTVAGLQAERVDKAAAWDALAEKNAKIAALESSLSRIKAETIEECARVALNTPMGMENHPQKIASAIRSLGSTGGADAEEGSTQKEGSR